MKSRQNIDAGDISISFESFEHDKRACENSSCHEKYEIMYVISGSGRYILEGADFPITARSLFLTRPFEYKTLILDEGVSFGRYVIRFSQSALSSEAADVLAGIISDASCGGIYYSPGVQHLATEAVFDRAYIAEQLPFREKGVFLSALLSELLSLLSAATGERLVHSDDSLAARVRQYINENIHRDLSLDKLSRRFFVSKYYLCRAFKQQNGTSIHNYINQKRVLYAKQLIEAGETASRAAYKVGFGDYSAFYRAYMKFQGVSPTSPKAKGD